MLSAEQRQAAILSPSPPATAVQAVALMRLYGEVLRRFGLLEADEAFGVTDVRTLIGAAIDAMIVEGTMTFEMACEHFGPVPADPSEQRRYVEGHVARAFAENRDAMLFHTAVYPANRQAYSAPHDHLAELAAYMTARSPIGRA